MSLNFDQTNKNAALNSDNDELETLMAEARVILDSNFDFWQEASSSRKKVLSEMTIHSSLN